MLWVLYKIIKKKVFLRVEATMSYNYNMSTISLREESILEGIPPYLYPEYTHRLRTVI